MVTALGALGRALDPVNSASRIYDPYLLNCRGHAAHLYPGDRGLAALRLAVAFVLDGVALPKASRWWLPVGDGQADVCELDPGAV